QFGLGDHIDWGVKDKRDKVKEMMYFAWKGYAQHAWGFNELRSDLGVPNNNSVFGNNHIGLTIIDSLDTLYIMGMREEFLKGKTWVSDHYDLAQNDAFFPAYELGTRIAGGFLSMYALTGEDFFRTKAELAVQSLLPIFQPSDIPLDSVNPKQRIGASGSPLTDLEDFDIGPLQLELSYASEITEKLDFRPIEGPGNEYLFEYNLKSWLRSNKTNENARKMYVKSVDKMRKVMLGLSFGGLTYLGRVSNKRLQRRMMHSSCDAGGLLALGSASHGNDKHLVARDLQLGKDLAKTCRKSYQRTWYGIGPESFQFDSTPTEDAKARTGDSKAYRLRPEVVETYFYLWRLTKDQKYRDWGWRVVQSLNEKCRIKYGFSGLENVYEPDNNKDGQQGSHFLSETLKYLYLLFSNDTLLPLDKWVFNEAGHPFPVMKKAPWRHDY
ncbi:hypothetical protein KR067_004128, partial [Drosophila pandora]